MLRRTRGGACRLHLAVKSLTLNVARTLLSPFNLLEQENNMMDHAKPRKYRDATRRNRKSNYPFGLLNTVIFKVRGTVSGK